jgi:hypothetical protein
MDSRREFLESSTQTVNVSQAVGRRLAAFTVSLRKSLYRLFVPGPDGLAFVVSEHQGVAAFNDFAGQYKVAAVLLDF